MVVASNPADNLDIVIGFGAMVAVMLATAKVRGKKSRKAKKPPPPHPAG
jgi:hypothetical protein